MQTTSRPSIALALLGLLGSVAPAAAQYTLTFDASTAGNTMVSSYQGSIPTSDVVVKDGVISKFGGGTITGYGSSSASCTSGSTTPDGGLCFQTGSTYGESGQGNAAVAGTYCTSHSGSHCSTTDGAAAVGEFDFTTVGSNIASFISVQVGCDYTLTGDSSNCGQSTNNRLELEIWNAAGTTELAYDFDPAFANAATSSVTVLASSFTTINGGNLSNLSTGFRFEWADVSGSTANCGTSCSLTSTGSDVFSIDNLTFDADFTPEPGVILLLGTGLVVLVPMARRRQGTPLSDRR